MGVFYSTDSGGASSGSKWLTRSNTGFAKIPDRYNDVNDVKRALREAGIESSNLIVGIDFTASNTEQGLRSFGGKSLHHLDARLPNPYEQALAAIARTLSQYDEDDLIPAYGFGDVTTHDQAVFCFNEGGRPCNGLSECLSRYRQIVPHVKLSGPTSFAPIIYEAMRVVQESGGLFHILVILADGVITRSSALGRGQWSVQERESMEAIVAASKLPLSIIVVGVGDGPWDQMENFDDGLPDRDFDNLQFVNFTAVTERTMNMTPERREAAFALNALMEVPEQYVAMGNLSLIGRRGPDLRPRRWQTMPLPPPPGATALGPDGGRPSAPPPPIFAAQNAKLAEPQTGPVDPIWFECPISKEIMEDPVIASDGHTYERREIEAWLRSNATSPMTGSRMPTTQLTPNHHLKSQIQEWRASQVPTH